MPSHYVLRVQADPAEDPEAVAQRMLRLAQESRADEICVFLFGMELNNGHETLDEVDWWLERTRPWRTALRRAGVAVTLNPGHTLGHADWPRAVKLGQSHWQRMVDPAGRVAETTVCPLDPHWRDYFAETMRRYCAEDVDVVWIEDDIRFHNHAFLEWGGCFCPLHLAELSRRAAGSLTREDVVARCTAPGRPDPLRGTWLDLWDETQRELVGQWRSIADEHGVGLGLMSSRTEMHAAEGRRWTPWLELFTHHRPHFWQYTDVVPSAFTDSVATLERQRQVRTPGLVVLPEIENWDYGQWNKSLRQTGAQMMLATVLGADGLALSMTDFLTNHPDDDPARATYLGTVKDSMNWLGEAFPLAHHGVGVHLPWSQDTGREVRLGASATERWIELAVPHQSWSGPLAAAGVATNSAAGKVHALSGAATWACSDEELTTWLSESVLLDAEAAQVLGLRGFGDLVGLDVPAGSPAFAAPPTRELVDDPRFTDRPGWSIPADPAITSSLELRQGVLADGAHAVSRLVDARGVEVGHGPVLYENARGGRVATVHWCTDPVAVGSGRPSRGPLQMDVQRARQLRGLVAWLGDGVPLVSGHPWLVPIAFADGDTWRLAVFNVSGDDCTQFTVSLPASMSTAEVEVTHMAGDGRREPGRLDATTVTVPGGLRPWECVVLTGRCQISP